MAVVVLAVSGLAYTFVVLQSAGPRQVIVTDLCSGIVSYNLTYVGAQSGFLRDWYMPTPGPPPPYCVTTTLPPGTTLN
ncbi:MAG TPA: hypothetical protein VEY07_05505, partial [Thermoplasmata archaeon]|nr:hypothetical protein [Thermoplasmata archaeon]